MKLPFLAQPKSAKLQADIDRLTTRQGEIQSRLAGVQSKLTAAKTARAAALAGDDDPTKDSGNIRQLAFEIEDLSGIADDIEAAIAQARDRLTKALDEESRQAAADELEKAAATIDKLAPDLQKAVSQLASVIAKMRESLPENWAIYSPYPGRPYTPEFYAPVLSDEELFAGLIVESIASAIPSVLKPFKTGNGYTDAIFRLGLQSVEQPSFSSPVPTRPLSPALSAKALFSDKLRHQARQIMQGDLEPEGVRYSTPRPYIEPVRAPLIEVIIGTRPVKYFDLDTGQLIVCTARSNYKMPELVATAAHKAELAFPIGTKGADDMIKLRDERARSPHKTSNGYIGVHPDQCQLIELPDRKQA